MKKEKFKLLLNTEIEKLDQEECLLGLINKNRTNIERIKFCSHYEGIREFNNPLCHLTNDVSKFMKQLRQKDYLMEAIIDEDGDVSNFLFRLKNSNILNRLNILKYITADIPSELKTTTDGNHIYIIRFYSAIKNKIKEEDAQAIVDDGGVAIYDKGEYFHFIMEDVNSIEKYWSEDLYKAIFATKKIGFSLGLNDPDKKANMEMLKEFVDDDEVFLFANAAIQIDNLKNINVAMITKRAVPNLKGILRKKFNKKKPRIPSQQNLTKKFLVSEIQELPVDEIDPMVDKIKLPRK